MRKLILILLFSLTIVFANDSTKVKTRKPWEFWVNGKVGLYSKIENLRYKNSDFLSLPSLALGLIVLKNRSQFGLNINPDLYIKNRIRYSYLNFEVNYSFSVIKKPKFDLSLGAGLLIGKIIFHYIDTSYSNNPNIIFKGQNDGKIRLTTFLSSSYKISEKISLGLTTNFLTSYNLDYCGGRPGHHDSERRTIDCTTGGEIIHLYFTLNYKLSKN